MRAQRFEFSRGRFVALVLLTALPPYRPTALFAQCPDGSPPPCTRPAPRATALPALDPRRIAILPFRVTAADSALGEGIAELLSAEFTGESGPRAVHMGNVIRAWRLAGGGARAPLTQPVAMRTARQLGAGYFIDGSIVGLGNRLTVNASVVSATDGASRHAEAIRGSADSLDVLMARLTTVLLALAGGESREGSRGVLTASPAAMRAYVEGMSAWRRWRTAEANVALERAFREDSGFARAALMRYWTANWFGEPVAAQWARTVFALRDRLSSADRVLVRAMLGERYPAPRTPAQTFNDRERAAALLPESPEAQYLAGDWLYHQGAAIDAADQLERARDYFVGSITLDSQQSVLSHLVDVSVQLADTALLRGLQPALEARSGDMYVQNWLAAGYLRDRAWLGRLRGRAAAGLLSVEGLALLPAALADEVVGHLDLVDADATPYAPAHLAEIQGRPEAARRARANLAGSAYIDAMAIIAAIVGDRDSAAGAAAARQLAARTGLASGAAAERDCNVALWRAWLGVVDIEPVRGGPLNCRTMVELLRAWRSSAPDLATRLEAADSAVRTRITFASFRGYENVVLARIWESQGNPRRALSAIRLYLVGAFGVGAGFRLREEGRLAAAAGQVDRAIEAYRRYLELRQDAEPPLRAERDSVRAALTLLLRGRERAVR